MYATQIKDINTITWHNMHFILEHYTNEILSIVGEIIVEGESKAKDEERQNLLEIKSEVIATVKTLKAMHTVISHHRNITAQIHTKGETK